MMSIAIGTIRMAVLIASIMCSHQVTLI
jgi:hypothetical protein